MNTPEPGVKYATAVKIPRHLYAIAIKHAGLVSQVTLDAHKFIFSRCNRDIKLSAVVGVGLSTLLLEHEGGKHVKASEFDFQSAADAHVLDGSLAKKLRLVVEEGITQFGAERVTRVAVALYEERRRLTPTNDTGDVYGKFDDETVWESTRDEYRWAAIIALRAAS